jgi:hypothetical protein
LLKAVLEASVEHNFEPATTELQSDCFVRHLRRCRLRRHPVDLWVVEAALEHSEPGAAIERAEGGRRAGRADDSTRAPLGWLPPGRG